jgi:hypothetical protein
MNRIKVDEEIFDHAGKRGTLYRLILVWRSSSQQANQNELISSTNRTHAKINFIYAHIV